ncbi:RidA family protein [Neogemmobacter tilapiae]|uniref:Enamine deaminase RidA n=1 Tax=Neogemmobacter tilapiae TaxID=875041 RepID=A0A918TP76_9RHOB|nr:RidA family protein [Gemmobacter tilapiae]GHC56085.1 enamine deaminase RidA [Gemmobacter tilapiae]
MTPITRMNPASLPDAGNSGYSQISIVEPGRLAFVSGQVAWTRDGGAVATDLQGQARIVAQNLRAALQALNATGQDIVMVRAYMVDMTPAKIGEVMPHLAQIFDGAQPSLTGIGVAALATPELLLEVELVVRLP